MKASYNTGQVLSIQKPSGICTHIATWVQISDWKLINFQLFLFNFHYFKIKILLQFSIKNKLWKFNFFTPVGFEPTTSKFCDTKPLDNKGFKNKNDSMKILLVILKQVKVTVSFWKLIKFKFLDLKNHSYRILY